MTNYYAGIGSRKTPENILKFMMDCGARLAKRGYTLRSGGAAGADSAFAYGARPNGGVMEIFRPRDEYSHYPEQITDYPLELWSEALSIAAKAHPAWSRCNEYARALHARNCFQVLGRDLQTPSEFVICWTPDGATEISECSIKTGGTGMAIRIASQEGIPVFNLQREDHLEHIAQEVLGTPHPADIG